MLYKKFGIIFANLNLFYESKVNSRQSILKKSEKCILDHFKIVTSNSIKLCNQLSPNVPVFE